MEVPGKTTDTESRIHASGAILVCNSCENGGLDVTAVALCRECNDYLCEICATHHCRPKPCKDHVLLRISTKLDSSDGYAPQVPHIPFFGNSYCKKHPLEIIKYICGLHNEKMCHACLNIDHKKCDAVEYLPDYISKRRQELDFNIKYVEEKTTMKLSILQKCVENNKQLHDKIKLDIADHRKTVLQYFDNIEAIFETKVQTADEEIMRQVEKMSDIKSGIPEINRNIQEADTLDKIDAAQKDTKTLLTQIGNIHCKEHNEVMSYTRFKNSSDLGNLVCDFDQPVTEFSLIKRLQVDVAGINHGSLKGCTILKSGKIVFSDWQNKMLLLVDSLKGDVSFHLCQEKPMEIARVDGNDIAVSFPFTYRIRFFNVTNKFITSPDCDIALRDVCLGLKYDHICRQLLLLSEKCIYFVDLKGNFMKEIDLKPNNKLSNHMAIVPGRYIYYSDVLRHSVTCIDYDGEVIKEYKCLDGDLNGPFGLFVDSANILYICSGKMLMCVTPDGKWQTLISPEDGYFPQTVTICEKEKLMYVGQAQKNAFYIPVFKITRRLSA